MHGYTARRQVQELPTFGPTVVKHCNPVARKEITEYFPIMVMLIHKPITIYSTRIDLTYSFQICLVTGDPGGSGQKV